MRIIGISGLGNAMRFKQAYWPGLDAREYRISQGHDSAAALVVDGEIVAAAAEERFSLQKHTGDFPVHAINYCLSTAGISIEEVDEIAHCFDYSPYEQLYTLDPITHELYREVFSRQVLLGQVKRHFPSFPADHVHNVNHHLAHAASAYFTSGWKDCLTVIIDAMGEVQSVTVYDANSGKLQKLREVSANDSIGILYSLVTLHLGFDFNADEYKIMGLAPYGNPERFRHFFDEVVELHPNGSIRIPILHSNRSREERENYLVTRNYLSVNLIPERRPDEPITDAHRDVAAALQQCLNRAVLHICKHFGETTGVRRLALAGGVALNCTANGILMRSGAFDEIYIQPAAGDDGAALGAALHRAALNGGILNRRMPVPFLGPVYSMDCIEAALPEFADKIQVTRFSSLAETCAEAARLIAEGRVLAWYRGRMEFGPRALGNRSILADPGHPEMRDRINAMVKKREAFRPFAPAVSLEQVHKWFDVTPLTDLPYMIATVNVREEHRALLPAITHVDGSARVQTVSAANNPEFHTLLQAVGKTTGREMVLNTSFNVKGQPIVNNPREAIATFLGTGIEFLFMENTLVARR
ncbi:MAG TPA: carbamoyltransferase C-terminal domain-containing protein [Bryobacteraceae bacterium]|nr:carbamoyltransferase C-terminal domain-containing protein [Bryobacteraceae bacterium]